MGERRGRRTLTAALFREADADAVCELPSEPLAPSEETTEGARARVGFCVLCCSESELPGVLSKPDSEQLKWPGRTLVALASRNSSSFVEWYSRSAGWWYV